MSKSINEPSLPERSRSEPLTVESVLPLVEERIEVTRQEQEVGAVRVRVEVLESTEAVPAEVRTQQVIVRRTPVGRPVAERQPPHQDGDEWVVPVYEEVPVVEMRLVLKEELRISRQTVSEPGEQQVRLRREVAVVERRQPDGSWQRESDAGLQGTSLPPAAPPT